MNYVEPPARNRIHNWRFEDGETVPNPGSPYALDPPPRGWYCCMYPNNDAEFRSWMEQCCPTADIIHRFNSGDPMWTVYIKDDREAMLFKLKWST